MTTASAEQPTLLLDDGYVGMHVLLDGCTVCGSRGYSLFRASQSIAHGRWYVEVTWLLADDSPAPHHNSSGHLSGQYDPAVRVGWCTAEAPVDAPVGFDTSGFAYASRTGHAFHRAQGKPYGRPFLSGDVIGMLMCVDERDSTHNSIHFSFNGCWQGAAFTAFPLAHYFPAVSAYQHAQLHCRFQPPYLFQPPWTQQLSGGVTVEWRTEKSAAMRQARYRYWRRNRNVPTTEAEKRRRGRRARKQRTLY